MHDTAGADASTPSTPAGSERPDFARRSLLAIWAGSAWLNFRESVKNVYFVVIALAGVLTIVAGSLDMGSLFGTTTYPVTYKVVELIVGTFSLFMLIITTFYAGELIWREREARISQMLDAMPLPSWLPMLAKLAALIGLQVLMLAIAMACGMLIQLFHGYFALEPGLYLRTLFLIELPHYIFIAVLAFALQVLINQKYLAYFAMILYYLATITFSSLGLDHPMLLYGTFPSFVYSQMNGFGHFLARERWFELYWLGPAIMMVAVSIAFWPRGYNAEFASRLQLARRGLSKPLLAAFGAGLALFTGVGSLLYYNLHIADDYQTASKRDEQQAQYELRYKRFANAPQPRIVDVSLLVDLQPEQRSMHVQGVYQLENRSQQPVARIYLSQNRGAAPQVRFSRPARPELADRAHGFYSYVLEQPLAPGERLTLQFELGYAPRGILGFASDTPVVGNGTFFNNDILPRIGYQDHLELQDDRDRKRHGLAARARMPAADDPRGLANSYIANDADWINFDAIVSTSPDQIAIAPGTLQKEWMANGRRHFHYRMDKPIAHFYAIQSARYEVRHDRWQDVTLDVYYHPGHEFNLERIINGLKTGLAYNSRHFSPYQHRELRVVEFPRYGDFAQSYPNTIPYSEGIGFIAKVDDKNPKDIDYPFYVSAHEVAHQWWGHQIIGGDTRGATVLSETLAEYAALMAMKETFGAERMRRFLRYDLDHYLIGRALEKKRELALAENENQDYIHYRKGSLAMYRLQDVFGEAKVNGALHQLLREHGFQSAPYPSVTTLTAALRAVAPAQDAHLIDDLFYAIMLFENRADTASAKKLADGRYEVTLRAHAAKFRAGELGDEQAVPLGDAITFGVDDRDGKPLLRERRRVTGGELTVKMVVSGRPAKAGIDPDNLLIDRKPDDNLVEVELGGP